MKLLLNIALIVFLGADGLESRGQIKISGVFPISESRGREAEKRENIETEFEASPNSPAEPSVYIPADQRHKGLSRYDVIPFTDRRKGDVDRYRAVNPKYVKKENGSYFYALQVKPDAHFFDENLRDRGVLSDANVDVDLTDAKTAKTDAGKTVKYVRVKDKGYILSSALAQTASEIKAGRWFQFPLKPGAHRLHDGAGIERGKLAVRSVKLNYGLQKKIKGEIFYYAFSTKLEIDGETVGASGWIRASAIAAGNDPQFDQNFVAKMQMPTSARDRFVAYDITGGDPKEANGTAANGAQKYKFGYADRTGNFVAYKVLPRIPLDGNQSIAATDYLKRSDAVINLGFNVAGVSNDTFRIAGASRPLVFYRSSEPDATAVIDLYYPKDAAHDGEKPIAQMIFVYGYVAVKTDKRWGWIALDALRSKSGKPKS